MLSLGPLALRWYSMAYIVGLLVAWRWGMALARRSPAAIEAGHVDRFLIWCVPGVIVGGRLGQVLFYHADYYLAHPWAILKIWQGGMSFHGGLIGVVLVLLWFCRRHRLSPFALGDICAIVAPVGIGLGRIANFINGEHWGRVSEVPWAVIFPRAGPEPRHPSQLYEAGLEGLALGLVMALAAYRGRVLGREGLAGGLFLTLYALSRMVCEIWRAPEVLTHALPFGTSWGQWLSLPMLLLGLWLMRRAWQRPPVAGMTAPQ